MGISSPGIGSGLDIKGIVSQLVALEKQPIQQLQVKAAGLNAKLSAYGQLKSQIANLQDQATKLGTASSWETMSVKSSNASAIVGTATSAAAPTAFSMEVSQLARAQAAGSGVFAAGAAVGTGTLKIQLGTWDGGAFTAGAASLVSVDITAAEDTLTKVAAKINAAGGGVSATVLRDASGERLLMRSNATGEESGFQVQAVDENGDAIAEGVGLARLAFNPPAGGGMALTQSALNTVAKINGLEVKSASTTFTDAIEGLTLTVAQVTTAPVEVSIARDTAGARSNITAFVESYNALSNALAAMTKYNPGDKSAGTLQGDSTAVNLQAALRQLISGMGPAGGEIGRLSDIGVQFQADGTLKVDDAKLTVAMAKPDALKAFFTADEAGTAADGMATRIKDFAAGMLGVDGMFATKEKSIESAVKRNTTDQERIAERASRRETQLLAQYNRLDVNLGKLTALNSFISQQVTMWNKKSDN